MSASEQRYDIDTRTELEDRTVRLAPGHAFTVPAGVMRCTHARGRSVVLMIEKAGVKPTGD